MDSFGLSGSVQIFHISSIKESASKQSKSDDKPSQGLKI
jgi:hypothetical protein